MNEVSEQVKLNKELIAGVDSLPALSQTCAECERNYKIALAQYALKLRTEGFPVTIIDKLVYGNENVAQLRFERDVAEGKLKAMYEKINSIKLQMRILQENIKIDMCSQG